MLKPVIIGVALGTAIPSSFVAAYYCIETAASRKAAALGQRRWLTFQPRRKFIDDDGNVTRTENFFDFTPTLTSYNKVAEVLITLSSASLVFIPNLRFSSGLPWLALPLVLLGFTVVCALAFMGFLTFFYEQSLYDPLNVTPLRQAINYGLGFGALATFALAYFFVAVIVAIAVSNGVLVTSSR